MVMGDGSGWSHGSEQRCPNRDGHIFMLVYCMLECQQDKRKLKVVCSTSSNSFFNLYRVWLIMKL